MVGSARAATPLSRGEKAAQRARGPPGRVLTQRLATERASNSDGRISAWRRKRDLGISLLCTSRPLIEFVLRHRAEATANIVLRPHNGLLSAPAWAAQFLFGLLLDRSGRSNYPVCPGSKSISLQRRVRCEPDFRGPIPSIRPHCLDLAAAGFRHSRSGRKSAASVGNKSPMLTASRLHSPDPAWQVNGAHRKPLPLSQRG